MYGPVKHAFMYVLGIGGVGELCTDRRNMHLCVHVLGGWKVGEIRNLTMHYKEARRIGTHVAIMSWGSTTLPRDLDIFRPSLSWMKPCANTL